MNTFKISNLLDSLESGTMPDGGLKNGDGEIPSLGGENIGKDGYFRFDNLKKVTEDYFHGMKRGKIQKDDVLIVKDGATTGRVAFIDDSFPHSNAAINEHLFRLSPNPQKIFPLYLYYYFRSELGLKEVLKCYKGSAIGGITRDFVERISLALPELVNQKNIALNLKKIDTLLEKRRQSITKLDQLTQSIFLDMFGDPVTNPKGWPRRKMKEMGKVVTGNTPSRKISEYYGGRLEWIKSDNINTPFHYLTEAEETLSDKGRSAGRVVPNTSILVTCIAGSKSCIGNVAMTNREVSFNQQINALVPDEKVTTQVFMYAQILFGKKLIQGASTNSMKGMVSKSAFEEIEVMIPPLDEQKKYSKIFIEINKKRRALVEQKNKLKLLSSALMSEYFS